MIHLSNESNGLITIIIDLGASEHVISERLASQFPTKPSALRPEVTDVQAPLVSVSRMRDAGHRVFFIQAGVIQYEGSGQTATIRPESSVYRMEVDALSCRESSLTRHGK